MSSQHEPSGLTTNSEMREQAEVARRRDELATLKQELARFLEKNKASYSNLQIKALEAVLQNRLFLASEIIAKAEFEELQAILDLSDDENEKLKKLILGVVESSATDAVNKLASGMPDGQVAQFASDAGIAQAGEAVRLFNQGSESENDNDFNLKTFMGTISLRHILGVVKAIVGGEAEEDLQYDIGQIKTQIQSLLDTNEYSWLQSFSGEIDGFVDNAGGNDALQTGLDKTEKQFLVIASLIHASWDGQQPARTKQQIVDMQGYTGEAAAKLRVLKSAFNTFPNMVKAKYHEGLGEDNNVNLALAKAILEVLKDVVQVMR